MSPQPAQPPSNAASCNAQQDRAETRENQTGRGPQSMKMGIAWLRGVKVLVRNMGRWHQQVLLCSSARFREVEC